MWFRKATLLCDICLICNVIPHVLDWGNANSYKYSFNKINLLL